MVRAIREHVTILPGGRIELQSPDLATGARAEVIVMVEDAPRPAKSITEFIGSCPGMFSSPEGAVAFIRELRDEWDRE